jgi:hypothetical protein
METGMGKERREAGLFWSLVVVAGVLVFSSAGWAESGGGDVGASEAGADELARSVVETAGQPREATKVAFSFVVEVDGEEKVRRRHVWWPSKQKLQVDAGETEVELRNLDAFELSKMAESPGRFEGKWEKVAPDVSASQAAKAWGWFVNDSYWLFAPSKLFDPGVHRSVDDQGRLVLTFDGVGLTPGDRYVLSVDTDRGVVTRWSYELESGRSGSFRWLDYREFGPLTLSTRRESIGGEKEVVMRFEHLVVE